MHNRRPLRLASTIGPIETGLLPTLEAAYSRQTAMPIEHVALGSGAALERAKWGGVDLVIAHAPTLEMQFVAEGCGRLADTPSPSRVAACRARLQRCFSRAAIDLART